MDFFYFFGYLSNPGLKQWLLNEKHNTHVYINLDDFWDEYAIILDGQSALEFKLKFDDFIETEYTLNRLDLALWLATQVNIRREE